MMQGCKARVFVSAAFRFWHYWELLMEQFLIELSAVPGSF